MRAHSPGDRDDGRSDRTRRGAPAPRRSPPRPAWGIAYRTTTMLGAFGLAALAFVQHTPVWDVVGAVLVAFAIVDLILLAVVTWFQWRHRGD